MGNSHTNFLSTTHSKHHHETSPPTQATQPQDPAVSAVMKAETEGLGPKEHEGFLAPLPWPPKKRSGCGSRSWSAAGLAAVGVAATAFFFLSSQAVLRGRPGGAGLAVPLPVPSSWPPHAGGDNGHGGSSEGWSWSAVNASRTLQWQPCDGGDAAAYDCARLDVPMDWQDPSEDRRVVLAVMRRRALDKADYRGPVFFNPGGPGASGIYAMRDRGALLHEIVGTNHDLVTWDPRGVGASVPRVDCWGGSAARAQAWARQDAEVPGAHAGALGAVYARATAYAQTCERAMADAGLLAHLSTAAHARDLLALLELTTGDKAAGLRYWGFSYGTLLGGTFAAMYPDRVERLVSDGNVDYRAWYGAPRNVAFLQDADRVLGAFAWFCHDAGPAGCAFHAATREGIHARLDRLLDRLREAPVAVVPAPCAGMAPELPRLVTWSAVRRLVSAALYQPVLLFPRLAEVLAALEQGDGRPFYELTAEGRDGDGVASASPLCDAGGAAWPPGVPRAGEDTPDAFPAIMCADMAPVNDTVDEFARYARALEDVSHDAGAVNTLFRMACVGRTVRPKWRYDGPFEANTSFPILFVNNVVDNVTPAASARNNSAGFPGSVLLSQNSYGHTSLAAASTCTSEYIHAYFQNGSLPANGTTCMPESYPFQELAPLAGNRLSEVTHALAKKRRRHGQWL